MLAGSTLALAVLAWVRWPEPVPEPVSLAPTEAEILEDLARALALMGEVGRCAQDASCGALDPEYTLQIAQIARWQLGHPDRAFRDDCSGFVSAVFTEAGVEMDGVVSSIYDLAAVHGTIHWSLVPRVGDVVFFDDTHDRNDNGRWDDPLTHIGLIVDVEPDGTAVYAHAGTSSGRGFGRINVAQPFVRRTAEGKDLNTYLREPEPGDPQVAGYLSGALWVGFASIPPDLDWRTAPPPPESWP
ncbi:MAG: hypothetical protein KC912_24955 [Proteobacteria bacterium]|nr:hypothetical protein [Pseudomonadota bacterium]